MKNSAKPDEIEVYDICLDASHRNILKFFKKKYFSKSTKLFFTDYFGNPRTLFQEQLSQMALYNINYFR